MTDALTQAQDFARLAGRGLGQARTIVENESATPPPSNSVGAMSAAAGGTSGGNAAAPIPVQSGQQEVSVVVTVTYDLN